MPVTFDVVKDERRFATIGQAIDGRFETHTIKQAGQARILFAGFLLGVILAPSLDL